MQPKVIKELKKLKRTEILELYLEERKENEFLKEEIADLKRKLEDRKISISRSGSIAEAALELSGIFEAAQEAADLYLDNIKRQRYSRNNYKK